MRFFVIICFLICVGCTSQDSYRSEIEQWRKERVDNLTAPIGWASLAGLYWLVKDTTSIGGKASDIILSDKISGLIGFVIYRDEKLIFESAIQGIYSEGKPAGITTIQTDQDSFPSRFVYNDWEWTFIERGGKTGLRVWDTAHVNRTHYLDLDYFPIDNKYKVEASFKAFDPPKEVTLDNILGMKIPQLIPGELSFNIDGEQLTLLPLDGGNDEFFIIFADETTGGDTYGGGRYLYAPKPKDGSATCYIDFNKAHTPPCGFTEYATCLLPTKENTLPVEIRAGERYLFDH